MLNLGLLWEVCHLLRVFSQIGPLTSTFLGTSGLISNPFCQRSGPFEFQYFSVAGRRWLSISCSLWHEFSQYIFLLSEVTPFCPLSRVCSGVSRRKGKEKTLLIGSFKKYHPFSLAKWMKHFEGNNVLRKKIRGETCIYWRGGGALENCFP